MTTNHTELCQRLLFDPETTDADAVDAAYVIKEQATRIQQQALEYVSLQAQCDEHLARVAELEKERDALKADAKRFRRLESDGVLHDIAPVIRWQTVMRFEPAKSSLNCRWTSEMKVVYVEQPIREIKLRWVDENNDQPTLLHMIDAALQTEKETG